MRTSKERFKDLLWALGAPTIVVGLFAIGDGSALTGIGIVAVGSIACFFSIYKGAFKFGQN